VEPLDFAGRALQPGLQASLFFARVVTALLHDSRVMPSPVSGSFPRSVPPDRPLAQPPPALRYIVEIAALAVPQLLAVTVCAENTLAVAFLLVFSALVLHHASSLFLGRPLVAIDTAAPYAETTFNSGRLPFLTDLRSSVMLLTIIAILAVDFPSFPRVFGKTEVAGFSIMDIGVGAVIFTGGLTSTQARLRALPPLAKLQQRAEAEQRVGRVFGTSVARLFGVYDLLQKASMHVIPLIVLGLLKLGASLASNYQTHVSEYGRHWNFFVTLALVPPAAVLLEAIGMVVGLTESFVESLEDDAADDSLLEASRRFVVDALPLTLCGLLTSLVHQLWLSLGGGFEWLVSSSRAGLDAPLDWYLLDSNREGVAGLVGFTSIALIGVGIGRAFFLPLRRHRDVTVTEMRGQALALVLISTGLWALQGALALVAFVFTPRSYAGALNDPLQPRGLALDARGFSSLACSRRTVNLSYATTTAGIMTLMLAILVFLHTVVVPTPVIARRIRSDLSQQMAVPSVLAGNAPPSKRSSSAGRARGREAAPQAKQDTADQGRLGAWLALPESLNRHGLVVFLVANVLTGVVNLGMGGATLRVADTDSVVLVLAYAALVSVFALELDRVGVILSL
jgi:glucosaminylphosphatidylinositol acyltransferase